MARNSATKQKRYTINEAKLKQAQKLLGAKTEAETIEFALDEVISQRERQRRAWVATERFLRSGIVIKDLFGRLDSAVEEKLLCSRG